MKNETKNETQRIKRSRRGFFFLFASIVVSLLAAPFSFPFGGAERLMYPIPGDEETGNGESPVAPQTMRRAGVMVDFDVLAAVEHGGEHGGEHDVWLWVEPFEGEVLEVRLKKQSPRPHHGNVFYYTGRVAGDPGGQVVMVSDGNNLYGNIVVWGRYYQVRPGGGGLALRGIHGVREIDPRAFPAALPPLPALPVLPVQGKGNETTVLDRTEAVAGQRIDVLVVYTGAARANAGGAAAMVGLINLAVAETNAGYENSGVTQRIRLVHTAEVAYDETNLDWYDALGRLSDPGDGFMDGVHQLRETHAADLVVLLVNNMAYCGLAYLMTDLSGGFSESAFSIVSRNCATGYYSFAHELGHNMGCHHDVDNCGGGRGVYDSSHGYQAPDGAFRTIMAFNCGGGCPRLNYWSNPTLDYGAQPMGDPLTADNRLTLNRTAAVVSRFREAAPGTPPEVLRPSKEGIEAGQGQNFKIRWSGFPGSEVAIDLYRGGNRLRVIQWATPNDGIHYWWIPLNHALGNDFSIRVTDTKNSSITDDSDNAFAIHGPTVTRPSQPGISWARGQTQQIRWVHFPGKRVKIILFKGNYSQRVIAASVKNTGAHAWTIPPDQGAGDRFRIKVVSTVYTTKYDYSDAYFEIR